jgi:hypothetical protein
LSQRAGATTPTTSPSASGGARRVGVNVGKEFGGILLIAVESKSGEDLVVFAGQILY